MAETGKLSSWFNIALTLVGKTQVGEQSLTLSFEPTKSNLASIRKVFERMFNFICSKWLLF